MFDNMHPPTSWIFLIALYHTNVQGTISSQMFFSQNVKN